MNISSTQSQGNILSQVSTRAIPSSAGAGQSGRSVAAKVSNLLELSNEIDPGFARSVLQDTVEKRLQEALTNAGIEVSTEEILNQLGDTSPQATAERIVEIATGFLEQHRLSHPDLESARQLEEFVSLVKGAVETGFEEAGAMLSQLGQIPGAVQTDIDMTLGLVMQGVDDLATDTLAAIDSAAEAVQTSDEESGDATTAI